MAIELGKFNNLEILRVVDFGIYLDGKDSGEILLPSKYVPSKFEIGDIIKVFVYLDSSERLIATTEQPFAQVGDFAYLEVSWTNQYGAFLSWGILKDLFVPFSEQNYKMQKGEHYLVYIYVDKETYRIVASAKINKFISKEKSPFNFGDQVNALVWKETDLGIKVIVENKYSGLLYKKEIFKKLNPGEKIKAYVKQVRDDGKIDLIFQKPGYEYSEAFSKTLFNYIQENNGFIKFTDKSNAADIYNNFGVSKKTFKKAIGALYKERLITIENDGIRIKNYNH